MRNYETIEAERAVGGIVLEIRESGYTTANANCIPLCPLLSCLVVSSRGHPPLPSSSIFPSSRPLFYSFVFRPAL